MLRTTGRLRRLIAGTLCAAAASALAGAAGRATEPLRPYDVEPGNVTVSGISSGAYMAVQLHVAFSASVAGAGVVAGGPFYCSENSAILAQSRCMATLTGAPDAERLAEIARAAARAGTIDPLENLTRGRVYIARGSEDPVVRRPVIDALRQFYLLAGVRPENVKVDTSVPAGHAFLTTSFGSDCDDTKPPFINDCDHDQAGAVLGHLLGDLAPPAEPRAASLVQFDQAEFLANPRRHGMDTTGLAYVPAACATVGGGGKCRLHVALHGCAQAREAVGDVFASRAGYNGWAETNRIVVLYPQAAATLTNPQGCWDWYGYDDENYHLKAGRQMAAIKRMMDRVAGSR